MKWLKKIDKKYLSIAGGAIALILWIVINGGRGQDISPIVKEGTKSTNTETRKEENVYLRNLKIPESIKWGEKEIKLDGRMKALRIKKESFGEERMKGLLKILGAETMTIVVDNDSLTVYGDESGMRGVDFNRTTATVKYSRNMLLIDPEKELIRQGGLSQKELNEKFEKLMAEIIGNSKGVKIRNEGMTYEEVAGPKYVPSDESAANVVKFTANYEFRGRPILSYTENPIEVRMDRRGNLLKVRVDLVEEISESEPSKALFTYGEIVQLNPDRFKAVVIKGTKEFEILNETKELERVVVTQGYSGYLLVPEQEELEPYHFFAGNSMIGGQPVAVTLGIQAPR